MSNPAFLNRELSWLEFNQRVLAEANDTTVPLIERLKFLGIYRSNLEEFFRVRIGTLIHRAVFTPESQDDKTGWKPTEELQHVLSAIREQQPLVEETYRVIKKDLSSAGIDILSFKKISKAEEAMAYKYFVDIRDQLSPVVADESHAFPFLDNRETAVVAGLGRGEHFRLGVVSLLRVPPYRVLEHNGRQLVLFASQVVEHFIEKLFKNEDVRETNVIRLTRNADVFMDYYEATQEGDARTATAKMLKKRKRQQPLRMEIAGKPSNKLLSALLKEVRLPEKMVFPTRIPFDLSFSSGLSKTPEMKYPERKPQKLAVPQKGKILSYLEKQDMLLAFPFQSMGTFVDMLYEAADDPDVTEISITLYRLSSNSKVAAALAYAADRGKSVLCLLELRARFDEQNNIDYSEILESAGCQIIYGLPEYKVHSKLCLIKRVRRGKTEYFTQVGTGNYNEVTAEQYTDLSVFTSYRQAGLDAEQTFAALREGQIPPETTSLWMAPLSYRTHFLELLEQEIAKGSEGRVVLKANGMNDTEIMEALVRASQAGVHIEMFIRGICCLKTGIPGYTENITFKRIVGRYLEHSRIYVFGEGKQQRIFVGSGDLLNRNTRHRVECFMELTTQSTRNDVLNLLDILREDKTGTGIQDQLYEYFGGK